jgi:hypothetical protein
MDVPRYAAISYGFCSLLITFALGVSLFRDRELVLWAKLIEVMLWLATLFLYAQFWASEARRRADDTH